MQLLQCWWPLLLHFSTNLSQLISPDIYFLHLQIIRRWCQRMKLQPLLERAMHMQLFSTKFCEHLCVFQWHKTMKKSKNNIIEYTNSWPQTLETIYFLALFLQWNPKCDSHSINNNYFRKDVYEQILHLGTRVTDPIIWISSSLFQFTQIVL